MSTTRESHRPAGTAAEPADNGGAVEKWRSKHAAASQRKKVYAPGAQQPQAGAGRSQQPEIDFTVDTGHSPGHATAAAGDAASERLQRIRQELADRRRTLGRARAMRMFLFIILPVIATVFYLNGVATHFYQSEAVFTIQTNDAGIQPDIAGGLAPAILPPSLQDALMVREYILSREMMEKVEAEHGYITHFMDSDIDPVARLYGSRLLGQDALGFYRQRVRINVDTREGILRLRVQALTPADARRFAGIILGYAEAHVNMLSKKIQDDQIAYMQSAADEAESLLKKARKAVVDMNLVGGSDRGVVRKKLARYEHANIDKEIAQQRWEFALQSLQNARLDSLRQRRYFSVGVPPTEPVLAARPEKLKTTFLALVIFASLYAIVAVFFSALREHNRL